MYWELYQQSTIRTAQSTAERASAETDRIASQLMSLENKVDSLALACQALWEIVQEHSPVSKDQLMSKMEEIDMRDGVRDGRMTPDTKSCAKCGRKTSRRRQNCLYCGAGRRNGRSLWDALSKSSDKSNFLGRLMSSEGCGLYAELALSNSFSRSIISV